MTFGWRAAIKFIRVLAASMPVVVLAADEVRLIDDFERPESWVLTTTPGVEARLSRDTGRTGSALRLDFDFHGTVGSVILHKAIPMDLPEHYAFNFQVRAEAPTNNVEFRLMDSVGESVWWRRSYDVQFARDWQSFRINDRMMEFGWGSSAGAPMKRMVAMEFNVTASSGGKGSLWMDDLTFEARPVLEVSKQLPVVTASSTESASFPAAVLTPLTTSGGWRSEADEGSQWLRFDFLKMREIGGMTIDWGGEDYAAEYTVSISDDGVQWRNVNHVQRGDGGRDYLYLPDLTARYLRLDMLRSHRGQGYDIKHVSIEPYAFSASPNAFFQQIARASPSGWYPRYWLGEQAFFTVVGADDGANREALLNTDGALEVDRGAFSVEPFVYVGNRLLTWRDVSPEATLDQGYLPIPEVRWREGDLAFSVAACAKNDADDPVVFARYRVENASTQAVPVKLFLALRPFQVNPPWQSLNTVGGFAPIRSLEGAGQAALVNGDRQVWSLTPFDRFGAESFEQGGLMDDLVKGQIPAESEAVDQNSFASGAFEYDLRLEPGASREIYLAIPPRNAHLARSSVLSEAMAKRGFADAANHWREKLSKVRIEGAPEVQRLVDVLRSNLAYIFINRDGMALQPGSRTYARTWIRDGAVMVSALLEMGYADEAREFIRWFARFQQADGRMPCCVDQRGADGVLEHDAYGEFIYALAEYFRFTGDAGFVRELWPHVIATVDYIAGLRAQSMTEPYKHGEGQRFFGLLPESISHEGYAGRPVHAFWDGFWTLRGLKDAVFLAENLRDRALTARYRALRDAYAKDLYAALKATMQSRHVAYLPASVELADFDPNAMAMTVSVAGEQHRLPTRAMYKTFNDWFDYFDARRHGLQPWDAYTPYEVRQVEAFIRLDQADRAHEVLDFLLRDQRPLGWNHWAEVVWRNPSTPNFIGDMPHAWIGAEFIRGLRSFLVYEREADQTLVLGAGLIAPWIDESQGFTVNRLPTWYGAISYRIKPDAADVWRMTIDGEIDARVHKVVVSMPREKLLRRVELNGRRLRLNGTREIRVKGLPAELVMHFHGQSPRLRAKFNK